MADTPISAPRRPVARPLSPHLMIFRPLLTMVMSILHRITGAALYIGTLIFVWWLVAAASGPAYYDYVAGILGSWFGQLILFGYTWALVHHALGGLRHFVWDFGAGFGPEARNRLAQATIIGSIALTLVLWIIAFIAA